MSSTASGDKEHRYRVSTAGGGVRGSEEGHLRAGAGQQLRKSTPLLLRIVAIHADKAAASRDARLTDWPFRARSSCNSFHSQAPRTALNFSAHHPVALRRNSESRSRFGKEGRPLSEIPLR